MKVHQSLNLVLGIILFATLTRIAIPSLVGHPPNFSGIDAIALFCGAHFNRRLSAMLITLLSVWVGDIVINSYQTGQVTLWYTGFYWQYACYGLIALLGSTLLRRATPAKLALSCLGSSILFFTITNFGVWYSGTLYPFTSLGLIECYAAAIPFFKNTLLSDLFFSAVFFGMYAMLTLRIFKVNPSHNPMYK